MDLVSLLHSLIPSWISVVILLSYFVYLGFSLSILPGKIVPGTILRDGSRIHYCCNGLVSLLLLVALLGIGAGFKLISPTVSFGPIKFLRKPINKKKIPYQGFCATMVLPTHTHPYMWMLAGALAVCEKYWN